MKCVWRVVMVLMWTPMLLFAWGPDVIVDTLRGSNNEYPVSYDIIWPEDTCMIVAVAYNIGSDSSGIKLFKSIDQGQTWPDSNGLRISGYQIRQIQLTTYDDTTAFIFTLFTNGQLYFVVFQMTSLAFYSGFPLDVDSVAYFSISKVIGIDSLTLFVAVTSRYSSSDTLRIVRLTPHSVEEVSKRGLSNTTYYRTYRDVDAVLKGDTTFVYLIEESLNQNTQNRDLRLQVYENDPNGSFYWRSSMNIEVDSGVTSKYPTCSVAPGGYVLVMYEVNGDINFVFSNNYGNSYVVRDFPFNTPDSIESTPFARWWRLLWIGSGFNTLFTRGGKLYFAQSDIVSDTLRWNDPVLVSDEFYYVPYFLRDSEFYLPKLANRRDLATPAVVWAYDFQHWGGWPPRFIYDSTFICVDNAIAVGVNEGSGRAVADFKVNISKPGLLVLVFEGSTAEVIGGEIISVDGRVVKRFNVKPDVKEYHIDVSSFPCGVYFVKLDGKKLTGVKGFVITR